MKVSVFLLVLTRSTTAWPGTPKMKNIGYLGSGYDFMFGNPHALGTVDPGFRDSLIDYVYMGQKTADDEYVIPNGINIRRCDACRLDWETNEVFGMNSYEHSLIDDATSIFKFLGFFSKASKDYSQVEKETTQFQRVVTESKASCLVYCADLVKTPGAFGVSPLKAALQTLPVSYNTSNATKEAYLNFLRNYGTHVTTAVKMGGTFGQRSVIEKTKYSDMIGLGMNIKQSGFSAFLIAKIESRNLNADAIRDAHVFSNHTESQQLFTTGGQPPANGQVETWIAKAVQEPMPVKIELTPIDEFVKIYLPHDLDKVPGLASASEDYCQWLVASGFLETCNPPQPDPPAPGPPPTPAPINPQAIHRICVRNRGAFGMYWELFDAEHGDHRTGSEGYPNGQIRCLYGGQINGHVSRSGQSRQIHQLVSALF